VPKLIGAGAQRLRRADAHLMSDIGFMYVLGSASSLVAIDTK
jgi:hypothetical protein